MPGGSLSCSGCVGGWRLAWRLGRARRVPVVGRVGGGRVVQTPVRAPNANAYAERFVRSITEECLDRVGPLGERHCRHLRREDVAHDHHERTHQGRGHCILPWRPPRQPGRQGRRRQRLGGLLNDDCRAA